MKSNSKLFKKVVFIILIMVFSFSVFMLGYKLIDRYNSEKLKDQATEIYNKNKVEQEIKGEQEEKKEEAKNPLLDINKDIVGWINIQNTRISYPVVQSKDNEYYLNHDIENKTSNHGSIFIDYRNSDMKNFLSSEKNIVLYGHNMKDGTMFSDLRKYKNEEFFKANQIISFDIFPNQYKWQVFSAYVTSTDFNYIKTDFKSDEEFNGFLGVIKEKSRFVNDIKPSSKDVILTLSTCSYEFENARFVVHFKLSFKS